MKKKIITLMLSAVCALSLVACSGNSNNESGAVASTDSVSKASTVYYYEGSSWDEAKVIEVIKNKVSDVAAVVVSTVNEDGSPNAATIVPGLDDENYLMFAYGSEGSTFENMKAREMAVLTIFEHNPTEEVKNQGARVVLQVVTDEAKINELAEKNQLDAKTTVFAEIVRVIPLG